MSVLVFVFDALGFPSVRGAEKMVSHAHKTASWYLSGVVLIISDIFIAESPDDIILSRGLLTRIAMPRATPLLERNNRICLKEKILMSNIPNLVARF